MRDKLLQEICMYVCICQWQNVNQTLISQETPHTSPSQESYAVSIVII